MTSISAAEKFAMKKTKTADAADDTNLECICERKAGTILCTSCNMFVYGRIYQLCEIHKNVRFLMDFEFCGHCKGPKENLRDIDIDYDIVKKINDVKLRK